MKIAEHKQSIFETYLNKNRIDEKAHHILPDAWKIVKEITMKKNFERKIELDNAIKSGKFLIDVNLIWKGISEGRVLTLFIERGLYQSAIIENDSIIFIDEKQRNENGLGVIDDIYDELIEKNMDFGGDVVFLPEGTLKDYNGFGAVTRY